MDSYHAYFNKASTFYNKIGNKVDLKEKTKHNSLARDNGFKDINQNSEQTTPRGGSFMNLYKHESILDSKYT